jgi:SET family sugar efflux transporter-like MFS transporter
VVYFAGLSLVRAPWHVYPLQIVSAAMISVVSGIAITFFQDFLPDQVGTATNVYSNAMRVGGTAGYLLFAALAEPFGHRAVFVFCTGMCLVATGILYFYRKPCTAAAPTAA